MGEKILHIKKAEREELGILLSDFAEDLKFDIGLWKIYENYNIKNFGTPLPLTSDHNFDYSTAFLENPLHEERIKHFLWIIYRYLLPDTLFAPDSPCLEEISKNISLFLQERLKEVPCESGFKKYLHHPVCNYEDTKTRLAVIANISYLFRLFFKNQFEWYSEDEEEKNHILGIIDIAISKKRLKDNLSNLLTT